MAEYSTAQMDESLTEVVVPEAAPRSWRRFGLVAAALGTVGAIFGMTKFQSLTPAQQMQQMTHAGHSFMQAVVARALQETTEDLSVHMGMAFAPKDMDGWNGLSVQAHLRPAEEEAKKPFVRVTFMAKEGQGGKLKAGFKKVVREAQNFMTGDDGPGLPQEAEDGLDALKITNDGDKVDITITDKDRVFGRPPELDMEGEPSLELSIKTGRDFQEIVDNIGGCDSTLLGGINVSASSKLAKAIIDTVGDEFAGIKKNPLAAFNKLSSTTTIKYDEAKLEAATCDAKDLREDFRNYRQFKRTVKEQAPEVLGPKTVKAASQLKNSADYVHSLHIGGALPNGYEIYVEFKNFKLTPVIADFLKR